MEQLGIEPLQLVTQIFNFVIMVGVLTYFLYKPILKVLADRRAKIAEGFAYAEKMKAEAEKTEAKRSAVLNEAKEEAQQIIEEGKKAAKLVEADLVAKAHAEAHAILQKGKSDVAMERADMEKKLKEQMIEVASAIAAKAISSSITIKDQHSILEKKIKAIAKQLS